MAKEDFRWTRLPKSAQVTMPRDAVREHQMMGVWGWAAIVTVVALLWLFPGNTEKATPEGPDPRPSHSQKR